MSIFDELSFREKSILISMLAQVLIFGNYFAELLGAAAEPGLGAMLSAMIGAIIALIVVEILFHAAIAIFDRSEAESQPADERDRMISGRASVISRFLLSGGVLLVLGHLLVNGALLESGDVRGVTLFEVANLLLFVFVLSEIVHYGAQLWFYRRG
ncbi:MAG: hypothetical protein ABJ308_17285 [Halieaceae bacterium]